MVVTRGKCTIIMTHKLALSISGLANNRMLVIINYIIHAVFTSTIAKTSVIGTSLPKGSFSGLA